MPVGRPVPVGLPGGNIPVPEGMDGVDILGGGPGGIIDGTPVPVGMGGKGAPVPVGPGEKLVG